MDVRYPNEAEWSLVSVLATGKCRDHLNTLQRIVGEDFASTDAGLIYNVEIALMTSRKPVGLDQINIELTRMYGNNNADRIMMNLISSFRETQFNAFAIPQYVGVIEEASRRRALDKIGSEMCAAASDGSADIQHVIDSARTALRSAVRDDGGHITGAEAALSAYEAAEQQQKPIPTGFAELDDALCGGLCKPELTIVGARPGKGKSALLLAMAMNAAKAGKHTAYFSLEMSAIQIGQRELAAMSNVSVSRQRYGVDALTQDDWARLSEGIAVVGQQGLGEFLHIYTKPGITVERLSGLAQNAADRGELDLLVIDYIQLMRTVLKTRSDFERIGIVSKSLKELALMLDVPILTAAQVRRQDSASGAQRAPGLAELRGSGDLEQDADNVLLIHSPETADDDSLRHLPPEHERIFERARTWQRLPFSIDVAKQRQGPLRRTWCFFEPKTMRFYDDKYSIGG